MRGTDGVTVSDTKLHTSTWDLGKEQEGSRADTCSGMTSLVTRNSRRWKSEMVSKNTDEVFWDK